MQFKRTIGYWGLLFTAVGGIIGSGWLFGPFYAAQIAGPAAILAWIIGGCLMILVALTFAEVATMFPLAGGMVRFAHFTHGPLVSFTVAWVSWLSSVIVASIETAAIVQYASNYLPKLAYRVGDTHVITIYGIGVAALIMATLCLLSFFSAKTIAKTNTFIVLWKLILPSSVALFLYLHRFDTNNFYNYGGFFATGMKGVLTSLPAAGIMISFMGFNPAIQMAGETKNPNKNIPIAIIGSILICTVIYTLIEIGFVGAVGGQSLVHGWQHIAFHGDTGPIAGLMVALGFGWFAKILYVDAVVSPCGTGYIFTASSSRINYAMAKNDYAPKIFEKLTLKKGIPAYSIVANFMVGLLFLVLFRGWQVMVNFFLICAILSYAIGPIVLLALRKKLPEAERPFKLPCSYLFAFGAFYICTLLIYWTGWTIFWQLLVIIAIGYVFFLTHIFLKGKQKELQLGTALWLALYLGGLGVLTYCGSFKGGKNILPFGWDFLIIAIFSAIILCLAKWRLNQNEVSL